MSRTSDARLATGAALGVSGAAMFAIAAAPALVALLAAEGGLIGLGLVAVGIACAGLGTWRRSERLLLGVVPLLVLGAIVATPRIALEPIATPVGALSTTATILAWIVSASLHTLQSFPAGDALRPSDAAPNRSVTFGTGAHRGFVAVAMLGPVAVFAAMQREVFFSVRADAGTSFVVAAAVFIAAITAWVAGVGPAIGASWDRVTFELEARRLASRSAARRQIVVLTAAVAGVLAGALVLVRLLGTG